MSACERFEGALRERDHAAPEEYGEHLGRCRRCAELAEDWERIGAEAKHLSLSTESERRRERVLGAVKAELARIDRTDRRRPWLVAAAAALLMTFGLAALWWQIDRPDSSLDEWIVRNQALKDLEEAERGYRESIDRLASLVEETETHDASTRLIALQEKLLLLDQAIAECEKVIEDNPYHADLRRELLSVYRLKDQTLREVLEVTRQ